MKKWIAILLTLTMVLGLFAACGSTTQPAASTAVSDPEPAEASAVVEPPPRPLQSLSRRPLLKMSHWNPLWRNPPKSSI